MATKPAKKPRANCANCSKQLHFKNCSRCGGSCSCYTKGQEAQNHPLQTVTTNKKLPGLASHGHVVRAYKEAYLPTTTKRRRPRCAKR